MSGNKVRAFGPGLEPRGNVVGEPASFTVETANAGKGKLDVAVNDPKGKQVKVRCVFLSFISFLFINFSVVSLFSLFCFHFSFIYSFFLNFLHFSLFLRFSIASLFPVFAFDLTLFHLDSLYCLKPYQMMTSFGK